MKLLKNIKNGMENPIPWYIHDFEAQVGGLVLHIFPIKLYHKL